CRDITIHCVPPASTPPPDIYTLSLHDALPIFGAPGWNGDIECLPIVKASYRAADFFQTCGDGLLRIFHAGILRWLDGIHRHDLWVWNLADQGAGIFYVAAAVFHEQLTGQV